MALVATRDLCVNGHSVPTMQANMSVVDPYELHEGEADNLEVALVEFMASGDNGWLQKSLDLNHKWFKENHWRIPLLQEVLDLIRQQKNKHNSGSAARAPRNRDCLIPVQVRGKTLLFKNDTRFVCFADKLWDPVESLKDFNWFLDQLRSDIGDLQEIDSDEKAEAKKALRPSAPADLAGPADIDLDGLISETREILQAHDNCLSANYYPSRTCFQVKRRCDRSKESFRVNGPGQEKERVGRHAGRRSGQKAIRSCAGTRHLVPGRQRRA